VFRYLTQSCIT